MGVLMLPVRWSSTLPWQREVTMHPTVPPFRLSGTASDRRWLRRAWLFLACVIVIGFVWAVEGCSPIACFNRDDGNKTPGARRYYRACVVDGHLKVKCDSATELPDPATWENGCR